MRELAANQHLDVRSAQGLVPRTDVKQMESEDAAGEPDFPPALQELRQEMGLIHRALDEIRFRQRIQTPPAESGAGAPSFDEGDRVKVNQGRLEGTVGTVTSLAAPSSGRPAYSIAFDDGVARQMSESFLEPQ